MDSETVRERELAPLTKIRDNYEKVILSLNPGMDASYDGIKSLNLIDWLLDTWEHKGEVQCSSCNQILHCTPKMDRYSETILLISLGRYPSLLLAHFISNSSVIRQNQEYHITNVHDMGLFPLSTSFPGGWDGMRTGMASIMPHRPSVQNRYKSKTPRLLRSFSTSA